MLACIIGIGDVEEANIRIISFLLFANSCQQVVKAKARLRYRSWEMDAGIGGSRT